MERLARIVDGFASAGYYDLNQEQRIYERVRQDEIM